MCWSGAIDLKELKLVMKHFGVPISTAQAAAMMEEADENHDGELSFMEFRKIVARKSKSKLWYNGAAQSALEASVEYHLANAEAEEQEAQRARVERGVSRKMGSMMSRAMLDAEPSAAAQGAAAAKAKPKAEPPHAAPAAAPAVAEAAEGQGP